MQGRGNKLYAGSRIILPEHREMLRKRDEDEKKIAKPNLDEQAQEIVNRTIIEALTEGYEVRITYYEDGHIYDLIGNIHSWDMYTQRLRVENEDGETQYIRFDDVLDVQYT